MVSVRIVAADHYMSAPSPELDVLYSDFRGSEVKQVPIIRIFGSNLAGKKVCLHVHGVFPYIYVPYDGFEPHEREAYRLSSALDKSLNVSLGKSNATTQHVYKICLVSGRPFYGYHEKEHQFFKIYLYNPVMVKRTADLLQSGAVLGKSFQPHEAHLSFILQFFIDFNLYGMNLINLAKVFYRRPHTISETKIDYSLCDPINEINSNGYAAECSFKNVPEDFYLPESIPRMSSCEIEMDTLATAISNRSSIEDGGTVIPGLAALWEEERERLRMKGLSSQLSLPQSETRDDPIYTSSEVFFLEKLQNQLHCYQDVLSHPSESILHTSLSLDTSGYPSETPENVSLQDATLVEVHLPACANQTSGERKHLSLINIQSEEDNENSTSQHSVLLDTQDEILMNEWGDMLEGNHEDSILSTQTPILNHMEPNVVLQELAEEVEDNHLLEMSQVFCMEDSSEKEKTMNLNSPNKNNENGANISVKIHPVAVVKENSQGINLNEGTNEKGEIPSEDGDRSNGICEWEDFWDDSESDADFDVEPIAQLDGADDGMYMKPKVTEGKPLATHRRRLGIRGRTTSSLHNIGLSSRMSRPSSANRNPELMPSTSTQSDKPVSENDICAVSPSTSTCLNDGFRPLISVAKHRRINELKRQSRISLSVAKDKPKKIMASDSGIVTRNSASRSIGIPRARVAGGIKARSYEVKHHSGGEKNPNETALSASSPAQVIMKACTIRLEYLNKVILNEICKKHGVILSSHSATLFKEASDNSEGMISSLTEKELLIGANLVKEPHNQNENRRVGGKKKNLSRQSEFVIDEDFKVSSTRRDVNCSRNPMKDRSFSTSGKTSSPDKHIMRNPSANESKMGSPKGKKDRWSMSKTCYLPITVKIQKSPKKNKEIVSTPHAILNATPPLISCTSESHDEKSDDGNFVTQEIPKTSGNDANIKLNDSFSEIMHGVGKASNFETTCDSPLVEVRSSCNTSNTLIKEKDLEEESEQKSSSLKDIEYNVTKARKQLKFSGETSEDMDGSDIEYFELTSDSCSRDSCEQKAASSRKSESESSTEDGDLGIVSFCVEDVMDISFPSPTFERKFFRGSQRLIESQHSTKSNFKDLEVLKTVSLTEMPSSPMEADLQETEHTLISSSLSSDESSVGMGKEDEVDNPTRYIEDYHDNGFEFAPLLKAPSWKEVEDYRFDVESKGLPFCSDPNDIPAKPMEVGELVLRLYSNRPCDLTPFENCLGCLGLEGHRKLALENTFGEADGINNFQLEKISKSALLPEGGTREVVIKPFHDPPKYDDVSCWLSGRDSEIAHEKAEKIVPNSSVKKVRHGIGLCMDQDDDDDDNDNSELISLSPCSSVGSQAVSDHLTSSRRNLSYQSTPHSSFKTIKQGEKLASPLGNSFGFSPIQEHNIKEDEDELIMCTPPPCSSEDLSLKSKGKLASKVYSFSRRRLLKESQLRKGEPEEEFSPIKSSYNSKNESYAPKLLKVCDERKLDLQKGLKQKSSHHLVGLGGSGHSSCQIDGMSPNNTYGFQNSPNNFQDAKAIQQSQFITVMTMEVQVKTRGHLRPDPEFDAIQAIFYSVVEDGARQIESNEHTETGVLMVESSSVKKSQLIGSCDISLKTVQIVSDESSLFKSLGELVQKWDPDIFAGYEVEMNSWGFVIERGNHLGMDVKSLLSRIFTINPAGSAVKEKTNGPFEMDSRRVKDSEDYDPIQLPGRIVLNVWRLMRSEAALMSYTFENVMYHLLHERIPSHSYKSLNDWWEHRTNLYRWITIEHWIIRVKGVMRLLVQLDIVGRTSELARLFGIQFYEVFSRGSQFRVESMMLRLAKPLNYVCVSPSSKQRAGMRAPEQLPLIMEPESRFYADPVIVLDFQSLYPSMIIAYNYCFSTCLGRVKHLGQPGPFEFGCTNLMVAPKTLAKLLSNNTEGNGSPCNLRSKISFSPCGVAFVGKEVRHGVLPKMLSEILETRLMVKKALKENKGNRVVERVLNSRQLGLKLIANVTYGYTAANFSGRMPCIEVGDSVVSKGRETLERAIALVHEMWGSQGVKVVYGDTDSLFVLAKGFSKSEAFKLGSQIAELVTESNPKPVKLKLEKVFQPCLLQTKKRYVGYAYETPDQENPIFDAKGIETVRRDGCPAVAKILEKSLRLLFDTRDVSLVKLHVQRQLGKLLSGRLSLQELTFAREYRGASGYRPGACVPALQLARRWLSADRRAEPRAGERVPYVIVNGPPGLPLFHLVRSPNELLNLSNDASSSRSSVHSQLQVNAHYYITKVVVPPLQRCFSLIGVDIEPWYADMPRKHRSLLQPSATCVGVLGNVDSNKQDGTKIINSVSLGSKRSTIAEYFVTSDCLSCGMQLDVKNRATLCKTCLSNPQSTVLNLVGRCNAWERAYSSFTKLCQSCCQRAEPIECISLDCPVLYRRHQAFVELEQAITLRNVLDQLT